MPRQDFEKNFIPTITYTAQTVLIKIYFQFEASKYIYRMVSSIDAFERYDHQPRMQNLRTRMRLLEGGHFNSYDFIS